MSFNKDVLRELNEAQVDNPIGTVKNLLDVSVQVRAAFVANDLQNGNIKLAVNRINMFILPDSDEKPGEHIDILVFNKSPSAMLYTVCHIYIIAMLTNKKIKLNEYTAAADYIFSLLKDNPNITHSVCEKHKQLVEYYETNVSKLDVLSYLF